MIPFIKSFNIHPSSAAVLSINWDNISWSYGSSSASITSKQLTNYPSGVTFFVSDGVTAPDILVYYQVSSSEITGTQDGQPASPPWTQVAEFGSTFAVNNNQWVSFTCYSTSNAKIAAQTVTVLDNSNSSQVDTFTVAVTA